MFCSYSTRNINSKLLYIHVVPCISTTCTPVYVEYLPTFRYMYLPAHTQVYITCIRASILILFSTLKITILFSQVDCERVFSEFYIFFHIIHYVLW